MLLKKLPKNVDRIWPACKGLAMLGELKEALKDYDVQAIALSSTDLT